MRLHGTWGAWLAGLLAAFALVAIWRLTGPPASEGRGGVDRDGGPERTVPASPISELARVPRARTSPEVETRREPERGAQLEAPDPGGPFRLEGRLDARPHSSANARISLHARESGSLLQSTGTRLSGHFEFEEVPVGEFELRVELAGGASAPEGSLHVRVLEDHDLGTWRLSGGVIPPRPETEVDPASEVVLVSVLRGGRQVRDVRVLGREEGGTLNLPGRREEDGRYRLEWRVEYGPLRICVEDSSGALLAATPIAQHYAPGVESEVRLDVTSGSLLLHLPHDYVIHEDTRLQLVLEGAAFPAGTEPVRTLSRRGAADGAPTFAPCDAYFPVLPTGTLTIRSTVLQRGGDGVWRVVGAGPLATATILADEDTVVRL